MIELLRVARLLVFLAVALAVLAAVGSWLIRSKRLSPFTPLGQVVRRGSDVLVKPMEQKLVQAGGNPVHAGWWLVGLTAGVGIVFLAVFNWLVGTAGMTVRELRFHGVRGLLVVLVDWTFDLLSLAVIVRVVASWLGISPYGRWMRPVLWVTDPVLVPLRRIIPPIGIIDVTPLVALILLQLAKNAILWVL